MLDPIRAITGWLDRYRIFNRNKQQTEQVHRVDQVAYAVETIRDKEIRVWFERDDKAADKIAQQRPECMVYTIPSPAFLIDNLHQPPPWRVRKDESGEV